MAYFILGVHEYSLQNYASAEAAWNKNLENEMLRCNDADLAQKDLNVLLSKGLIGLLTMNRAFSGLRCKEMLKMKKKSIYFYRN